MAYDLDAALRAFLSWGVSTYPVQRPCSVGLAVGPADAAAALKHVSEIVDQLDAIIPNWTRHDLVEAAQHAAQEVAKLHPGLGLVGIATLEWTYSWWYK